jgi:hypothetical protein
MRRYLLALAATVLALAADPAAAAPPGAPGAEPGEPPAAAVTEALESAPAPPTAPPVGETETETEPPAEVQVDAALVGDQAAPPAEDEPEATAEPAPSETQVVEAETASPSEPATSASEEQAPADAQASETAPAQPEPAPAQETPVADAEAASEGEAQASEPASTPAETAPAEAQPGTALEATAIVSDASTESPVQGPAEDVTTAAPEPSQSGEGEQQVALREPVAVEAAWVLERAIVAQTELAIAADEQAELPGCAADATPSKTGAVLAAQVTKLRGEQNGTNRTAAVASRVATRAGTGDAAAAPAAPRKAEPARARIRVRSLPTPQQADSVPASKPPLDLHPNDLSAARSAAPRREQSPGAPGWLVAFTAVSIALAFAALLALGAVLVGLRLRGDRWSGQTAHAGPGRSEPEKPNGGGINYRE